MLGWARAAAAAAVCAAAAVAGGPSHFECSFKKGDTFELRVYLSDSPRFVSFNSTEALVWHERNLRYDASQPERTNAVEVPISRHLLANASLYAHAYVTKEGHSPDPSVGSYDRWATSMLTRSLVSYGARLEPLGGLSQPAQRGEFQFESRGSLGRSKCKCCSKSE